MKIEEELGMIPLNSKGTKTGNVNYAFWVYFKKKYYEFRGTHACMVLLSDKLENGAILPTMLVTV
jgi:hypothetical protein